MSEENEHTSEDTETEMNTESHSKQQSKSETSMLNNETEQPMLEDEEMPTYISVSSPSRREDSDLNNTKQQDRIPVEEDHSRSPYPSDDQGGGSIYVLSSGEESNHGYNDEEDDEYADSDEMDEMDLENEHDNVMLEGEEEEDEDDDEEGNPLRLHHEDFDDDMNYDPEYFDRVSDDFVLNTRLKHHPKERSLSLQDLSITKSYDHSPFNKKRHSLHIFRYNYSNMHHNHIENPVTHKKQMGPHKYQHVESKVRQYIRDIKEQNKKSLEKRIKEQECIMNKNHEENENKDTEQLKVKVTNKTIKDYAEKAIKDLQREENEDGDSNCDTGQIVENGGNNKASNKGNEGQYKHVRKDAEYNDIQSEKRAQNCDDKLEKRNGSVDVNKHHIEYQNTTDRNVKFGNANQPSLVNGHQQTPTFINLRTLSYEEYLHDTSNTEQGEESEEKPEKNESEEYNDAEMINAQEIDNSNTSCPLKIENVKSIRITQDESENLTFAKISPASIRMNTENTEIIQLKAQLTKKDEQFHNLRDAYRKTLTENMKMKQELDALKKSLAKYEGESKTCETKIASVQTEAIVESTSNKGTTSSGETNNKMSTSSVASTVSSGDQWAESAYSPAISIKPPDLTPILNSDDSIVLTDGTTPRKIAHPISRTFITSSRILQTLSNITQGKTKVESPLVKDTNQKRLNENSDQLLNLAYNSSIHASSSKKRKATEMLGPSTFIQPFKIPHTSVEMEGKNSTDTTEVTFKRSEENANSKSEQEAKTSVNKNDDSNSVETKMEETDDHEDSVKCFVYRDDENSKNRSFLIQAEEPTKNRLSDEKNRTQECGPYLLGNLEVRMSEINGTISVWGKEISHESASDNEDEAEVFIRSPEKQTCHCWQNISLQTKFNGNPFVCSTNKKQRNPLKFNRSNISPCSHNLSLHSVKDASSSLIDDISDKRHMGNYLSPNTCVPSCERCDSSKYHKEWSTCKGTLSSQEKLHSCCMHHTEVLDKDYNYGSYHEKQKYDSSKCFKDKFHNKGMRRNSYRNTFTPDSKNHSHGNMMDAAAEMNEAICKYHTSCRRSLQNMVDCSPHSKCCNTVKDACACKSSSDNISNHDNFDIHSSNHSLSNNGEEDPLITHKRSNETPETRQRRLSGKRVRGILMDLLRGCGDCRSNNTSSLNKSGVQQKETSFTANGPPQIKISSTSEPTCSSSTQCNSRCCHAYARRIETQLEEFRMEMERVRSRSDAILKMLNMLHSVDMN
ncbi:hypothetical protein ANTQUA_LOCUS1189 [Anthophora quadrimaculata]